MSQSAAQSLPQYVKAGRAARELNSWSFFPFCFASRIEDSAYPGSRITLLNIKSNNLSLASIRFCCLLCPNNNGGKQCFSTQYAPNFVFQSRSKPNCVWFLCICLYVFVQGSVGFVCWIKKNIVRHILLTHSFSRSLSRFRPVVIVNHILRRHE